MQFGLLMLHLLSGLVLILTALKVFEIWKYSIIWMLKRGIATSDQFHSHARNHGHAAARKYVRNDIDYRPWQLTNRLLTKLHNNLQQAGRIVFSWWFLVMACALGLIWVNHSSGVNILTGAILVLLVTRFASRLSARLLLGAADSHVSHNWRFHYGNLDNNRNPGNVSRIARRIAFDIMGDAAVITLVFSILYFKYDQLNPQFMTPPELSMAFHQSLYFSFVTVTTTGYGDIYPASNWAVLLALTQMVATWSILFVMSIHYGLTLVELEGEAIEEASHHDSK